MPIKSVQSYLKSIRSKYHERRVHFQDVNILSVCHSSEYFSVYSGLNIFPCFRAGDNQSVKSQGSSSGGGQYQMMTNGHSGGVSPNSSQLSTDGRDQGQTLVTRTQKQHVMTNVSQFNSSTQFPCTH